LRWPQAGSNARTYLAAAAQRLVELYRAWERPEEAARWEKVLAGLSSEPKP
jgi:hypothetical protein